MRRFTFFIIINPNSLPNQQNVIDEVQAEDAIHVDGHHVPSPLSQESANEPEVRFVLRLPLTARRVQNIYDVNKQTYILKLSKPDHREYLLLESGSNLRYLC